MIGQLGNLGQLGLSGGSRQLTPRMVPGCMWEYDLYNWSTLFQDKNGTIPVTDYGQPVGLLLDLSQGLVLGPELVTNGGFDSGTGWSLGQPTSGSVTISNGVLRINSANNSYCSATQYNVFVVGKWYRVEFDVVSISGNIRIRPSTQSSFPVTSSTGKKVLYFLAESINIVIERNSTCDATIDNISVKEIPGNHRFSESAARPTLELSASGKPCLSYNGVGQFMQTNPFAWESDEVCVVMGMRKLSDASAGMMVEFSPSAFSNAQSYYLLNPRNTTEKYPQHLSKGTSGSIANASTQYPSPVTHVISAISKISTDLCSLYINGVEAGLSTTDQGTGNYGTYSLYFGSRAGISYFFNGEEYSSCGFNKLPTDAQFLSVNRWANNKTGAY